VSDQFLDVEEEPPVDKGGIESILRQLLDLMASAKSMPLSSSVMVSREEVTSLVQAALEALPEELRQARWLLRERAEFMAERTREAEALMDEVRAQAEHMVQRTEIVRQANSVAQRILDDANEEARALRHQAEDFVDTKLAGMEIVLDRLTRTVQAGRAKLAAPLVEAATETVGAGTEEDGFFDQDQT
jgi:Fe2+ transport system protein B